jgi:hypothetical protein
LPQPTARRLERYLAATHEGDTAVGDDHARGEIDGPADQQNLALPDDAVGLKGTPGRAFWPGDWRNITCRSMLLFLAVDHAVFPRPSQRPRTQQNLRRSKRGR